VVIEVKYLQQIVGHCYSYLLSQSENHLRFVLKMTVDRISHSALHARFKVKRNKGRPRLRRIDNMNEDIESVGPTLRWTMYRGQWRSFICNLCRQMAGIRNWWRWWYLL